MPTSTRTGPTGIYYGSNSKSFRALNPHLISPEPQSSPSPAPKVAQKRKDGAQRIRQNGAGLNKTEQAFLEHLECRSDGWVLAQAVTLRLGNGVRYTPDFVTVANFSLHLTAYEVKGFMRDDAAVKLKVAAAQYPWIKFHLVTKKKGGGWDIQEVLK